MADVVSEDMVDASVVSTLSGNMGTREADSDWLSWVLFFEGASGVFKIKVQAQMMFYINIKNIIITIQKYTNIIQHVFI